MILVWTLVIPIAAFFNVLPLLLLLVLLADWLVAAVIYAWCPGSCREWWRSFYKKDRRSLRLALVIFGLVAVFIRPTIMNFIVMPIIVVYVGWFNASYHTTKMYIGNNEN